MAPQRNGRGLIRQAVTPGIYQVESPPSPMSPHCVNCYLVQGSPGWLLVDTGWYTPEAFSVLKDGLITLGLDFQDISQIVCTHTHGDHSGLANHLQALCGARLLVHRLELEWLAFRFHREKEYSQALARLLLLHGVPSSLVPSMDVISMNPAYGALRPDVSLEGGETVSTGIFNFQVLWTPGHSQGHICLYEPEKRLLISGDHVLPGVTSTIQFYPFYANEAGNPLGDYTASLNRVRNLSVELTLPAHQGPFAGLRGRIDEVLHHHQVRNETIGEAVAAGCRDAWQVARHLRWDTGSGRWQDLSGIDKRLALMETIAHLEWLRQEGRLLREQENGRIIYEPGS